MKKLYSVQSVGVFSIRLEIQAETSRGFNDEDIRNASKFGDMLKDSILEQNYKLDNTQKRISTEEKKMLMSSFDDYKIFVEEIPNEYCSSYCCKHLPWFIVTTHKGRIKIGWRKRVINIDWSDSVIKDNAKDLFSDEDTTKGDKYIHAWGYDKAKEYISNLLK